MHIHLTNDTFSITSKYVLMVMYWTMMMLTKTIFVLKLLVSSATSNIASLIPNEFVAKNDQWKSGHVAWITKKTPC